MPIKNFWAKFKPSDRISAAALVVSLVAIGLGIHESYLTREHERLSVVPKLDTKFVDGSDGEITGIVLENKGLGPAHVLNVRLSTGSKFVADIYGDDQWQTVFNELGSPPPNVHTFSTRTDFFIAAGGSLPLLWLRNKEGTESGVTFLRNVKERLMISSCFCSLYDECWRLAAPGQNDEPCDSLLARYFLLNEGLLAEQLKGRPRVIEPRSVH
jgi:hypothetical protein